MQPDGVNVDISNFWLFNLIEFIVWNIWGLVAKIQGLENLNLWQNSISLKKNWAKFDVSKFILMSAISFVSLRLKSINV